MLKFCSLILLLLLTLSATAQTESSFRTTQQIGMEDIAKVPEYSEPLPQPIEFPLNPKKITVMTYNTENLFDTVNEPNKVDETYLPLLEKKLLPNYEKDCARLDVYKWRNQCLYLDWNEDALNKKLERLSQVIRSVNDGKGPDILVLQEVENKTVLEALNSYLTDLNYQVHLHEDSDYRGIDIGVLTRVPVLSSGLHKLVNRKRKALKMQFDLGDNHKLTLYGVHFVTGWKNFFVRIEMLEEIRKLIPRDSNEYMIVAGDFNFPKYDLEENKIINRFMRPQLTPSHLFCKNCSGTYYNYKNQYWSFFDMILLSANFYKSDTLWTLDQSSFRIHAALDFQLDKNGKPADYDPKNDNFGVSDHFPVVIDLVKTK